jgi:hypothetical protein
MEQRLESGERYMRTLTKSDTEWMGSWSSALALIARETGYDPVDCEIVARAVARIHPSLRDEVLEWWSTGKADVDRNIAGYSIRSLIGFLGPCVYVIEAFTWLSDLLTAPELTLASIERPLVVVEGPTDSEALD